MSRERSQNRAQIDGSLVKGRIISLKSFTRIITLTDGKILAYLIVIGEQPHKTNYRKKANSDKDRRILRIIENYHLYEDDLLTYIDLLKRTAV